MLEHWAWLDAGDVSCFLSPPRNTTSTLLERKDTERISFADAPPRRQWWQVSPLALALFPLLLRASSCFAGGLFRVLFLCK